MDEDRCPNLRIKRTYYEPRDDYFEAYLCDLNDKFCLREYEDNVCEVYEEWLKERAEEDKSL